MNLRYMRTRAWPLTAVVRVGEGTTQEWASLLSYLALLLRRAGLGPGFYTRQR